MEQFIKYVGLDVHGKTIAAAVADSRSSEVIERWKATGAGWQTRMAERLSKIR